MKYKFSIYTCDLRFNSLLQKFFKSSKTQKDFTGKENKTHICILQTTVGPDGP